VSGLFGTVYGQETAIETNKIESELYADSYVQDLASRLESSGFDIKGSVIDSEGVLLNDVKMDIVLSSPILPFMTSSKKVNKTENVNSEFAVYEKGVTSIVLSFSKKGYYHVRRSFSSSIFEEDPSKIMQKHNIQIKMTKKGTPAELICFSKSINSVIKEDKKNICDLSILQEKSIKENDRISLKSIDSKTKLDTKYIELDFNRDKKGNIIYDSKYRERSCPSAFVIRFHSNDPDDGLILINDQDPLVNQDIFNTEYNLAPEKGYTKKEIIIKLGEKGTDGNYPCENNKTFVFLKCGKYYGKAIINELSIDYSKDEIKSVSARVQMDINKKEGDRNLTEF
jgi:hypothetical protein